MMRSIAFTILMSAGWMVPAAQAQPISTALVPFAYLNAACLVDPTEPDFDKRAQRCATLHAGMAQDALPIIRLYSPGNVLRVTRGMDEMFIRQEKDARKKARRDEVFTVAYAAHLRCLGKTMLTDRHFMEGDGFNLNRVKPACPETRAQLVAARHGDAGRRSFNYLRHIETGGWSLDFQTIGYPHLTGVARSLGR